MVRELATLPIIKQDGEKLLKEGKVYKVIKLDLFDEEQIPFIRYYRSKV